MVDRTYETNRPSMKPRHLKSAPSRQIQRWTTEKAIASGSRNARSHTVYSVGKRKRSTYVPDGKQHRVVDPVQSKKRTIGCGLAWNRSMRVEWGSRAGDSAGVRLPCLEFTLAFPRQRDAATRSSCFFEVSSLNDAKHGVQSRAVDPTR